MYKKKIDNLSNDNKNLGVKSTKAYEEGIQLQKGVISSLEIITSQATEIKELKDTIKALKKAQSSNEEDTPYQF